MQSIKEQSLIDSAERVIKKKKSPLDLYDLFNIVCAEKGYTSKEKSALITQFYTDLITSAKFVYTGNNTWDLKGYQKIDLREKDGSFYKEYTVIEDTAEEKAAKAKAKPKKKAKAKPKKKAKAKVKPVVKEVIVEEVVVKEIVPEETVGKETATKEETKAKGKPKAKKGTVTKDTKKADDETVTEYEEEVLEEYEDEFDEDKYNEYMDTYEDKYDEK